MASDSSFLNKQDEQSSATLTVGDIEIGAVEIKDGTLDTRLTVRASTADGTKNGIVVINPDGSNVGGSSGGLTDTQLRATPVPVSGTVTVSNPTTNPETGLAKDATLTGGTQQSKITDGTNVATVKAASTAAVASDKAVVVAVSPNNTVPVSLATNTPTLQSGSTTAVTQATGTNLHTVVDSGTITANAGTNLNTSALALDSTVAKDATLTGGTQKAIARGGAKGTTTAADVTSVSIDANTQALHTNVTNFPATQAVTGPLTDSQLRATPVPVTSSAATNGSVTGTLSATGSITLTLPAGTSSTEIQFVSTSFVGTIIFESSEDSGTTYNSRVYRGAGILNNLQTTLTNPVTGDWRGNSAGMTHVRVRCSAYTSGSLAVTIISSTGAGAVFLNAAIPIGGESVGNTNQALSLATATSFTGTFEDLSNVAGIAINTSTNQAITVNVQFSQDGSTVFVTIPYAATAAAPLFLTIPPRAKYFRIKVDNNSGSTATIALQTVYRAVSTDLFRTPMGSSNLLTDTALVPPVRAVLTGRSAVDTYNDQNVDTAGNAYVTNSRFNGGKLFASGTLNTSGDNVVITPAAGKAVTVYWVALVPNSDNSAANLCQFKFGAAGSPFYTCYAIAHWEPFTGAVNQTVIINLTNTQPVAYTIHYTVA